MHVPLAKKKEPWNFVLIEILVLLFFARFFPRPALWRSPRSLSRSDHMQKMSYIDTYVHACSLAHFPPTPSSHPHHMDPWPDSPRERERRWPPPPPWPLLSWLCPVVKTSRWLSLSFVWWLRGGLRWVGRLRDRSVDRWIDTRQTN